MLRDKGQKVAADADTEDAENNAQRGLQMVSTAGAQTLEYWIIFALRSVSF